MTEIAVRRLTTGDAAGFGAAVRAGQAHGEFRGSSDPEGTFILRMFDADPSIFGGAFAGDRLVGLVSPEVKFALVAPPFRRREIGRRLLDLGEAMERDRGRASLFMGRLPDDEVALAFLTANGFAFHSTLWDLRLGAGAVAAPPAWPAGVEARDFDVTRDVDPWVALFNAAFADHATPLQLDPSMIAAGLDDPTVVDADTLVVADRSTGELVGFCATAPSRTDGVVAAKGEIWTIGVRPERQGQGLGRQLLRWGVQRLRSLGVDEIDLSVNARNERALHLYEAEGFVRTHTRERWTRPVASRTAEPGSEHGDPNGGPG